MLAVISLPGECMPAPSPAATQVRLNPGCLGCACSDDDDLQEEEVQTDSGFGNVLGAHAAEGCSGEGAAGRSSACSRGGRKQVAEVRQGGSSREWRRTLQLSKGGRQ